MLKILKFNIKLHELYSNSSLKTIRLRKWALPDCPKQINRIQSTVFVRTKQTLINRKMTLKKKLTPKSRLSHHSHLTFTVIGAPQMTLQYSSTFPWLLVFCCPQAISKLHFCPFFDVIFPSLLLSSYPSCSFH